MTTADDPEPMLCDECGRDITRAAHLMLDGRWLCYWCYIDELKKLKGE